MDNLSLYQGCMGYRWPGLGMHILHEISIKYPANFNITNQPGKVRKSSEQNSEKYNDKLFKVITKMNAVPVDMYHPRN
jgi:hypothetical protein